MMRPVQTSCLDHMGSAWARIHTWDGKKWYFPTSDWYQGDEKVLRPMVISAASRYAEEKKIVRRTAEDCKK
jgi:branched-chain amino acid transport system substrate-binding protein